MGQSYTEFESGSLIFLFFHRMDSVAHKKNLILRSYQSANIIELLPYHHCDSRSQTKAEVLKCLINLQIQHVDARFAVFLTGKFTTEFCLNFSALEVSFRVVTEFLKPHSWQPETNLTGCVLTNAHKTGGDWPAICSY